MHEKRKVNISNRSVEILKDQFLSLHMLIKSATEIAQNSGITKTASTIFGKIEQANKWCINPLFNDNGLGKHGSLELFLHQGTNSRFKNLF